MTFPLYYENSATGKNVVVSTVLDMIYLEDSTRCSTCLGTPIAYSGTVSSSFVKDLNYSGLSMTGVLSSYDVDVSFSSAWGAVVDAS